MRVTIYTDGGADPNPGIGGWAAILKAGRHEKVLSGSESWTTNNRMELQAALEALKALNQPSEIDFHTDSEYLRLGITEWISTWAENGWKKKGKEIANLDLWQELWEITKGHNIDWHWVKGHAGNSLNERVDRIARKARLSISPTAQMPPNTVLLFTRGTCKGNPGPGAWGVVIEQGEKTEQYSGTASATTNNRMELQAVIEGLRLLGSTKPVQVITTSDYVYQGATRWIHGWRNRDWRKKGGGQISNIDLWKELEERTAGLEIQWTSAKGSKKDVHPGVAEAGELARTALVDF